MSGAQAPDDQPATRASCMYVAVEGPRQRQAPPLSSSSHRGRSSRWTPRLTPAAARSAGVPSKTTRCLSTTTRSRSSATAPTRARRAAPRRVVVHQVDERVAEQPLRLRVDTGDRLVEHQQLGIGGQRLGDAAPAAAARPRARAPARRRWSVSATASRAWSTASRSAAPVGATSPCRAMRPAATTSPPSRAGRGPGRAAAGRSRPAPVAQVPGRPPNTSTVTGRRAAGARGGCAAGSTSPTRSAPPAPRTRPREADVVEHDLGAVGERDALHAQDGHGQIAPSGNENRSYSSR